MSYAATLIAATIHAEIMAKPINLPILLVIHLKILSLRLHSERIKL